MAKKCSAWRPRTPIETKIRKNMRRPRASSSTCAVADMHECSHRAPTSTSNRVKRKCAAIAHPDCIQIKKNERGDRTPYSAHMSQHNSKVAATTILHRHQIAEKHEVRGDRATQSALKCKEKVKAWRLRASFSTRTSAEKTEGSHHTLPLPIGSRTKVRGDHAPHPAWALQQTTVPLHQHQLVAKNWVCDDRGTQSVPKCKIK